MTPSATFRLSARNAELLGGEVDQDRAHFGAREPQRGAAVLDRQAAGGLAFVRRAAGVAGDDPDPRERQIELLGRDLRQGGEDALPQLHLAGEDGGGAVGIDREPGAEQPVGLQAARQPRRFLRPVRSGVRLKASTMPPSPAVKSRRVRWGAFMIRSSRWSAQRAGRRARCGCGCRSGRDCRRARRAPAPRSAAELRSSSAFAAMIMPLMQ